MEIKPLSGNDQMVIVVDTYMVIDRQMGDDTFEWKNERKSLQPKLTLKGGKYVYSGENLGNSFREGDKIVFLEVNAHTKSLRK